jgi:hypothetical protein
MHANREENGGHRLAANEHHPYPLHQRQGVHRLRSVVIALLRQSSSVNREASRLELVDVWHSLGVASMPNAHGVVSALYFFARSIP